MSSSTLIGRDAEIAELEQRARTNRLVTVVGPGGVGKTALARTVADRLASQYAMGVRQVDLTRIDDEQSVPGALATQLGFDSFDALLSSPNDRPVLLVVDNCEHLLDAVATAIVQVLGACHQPVVVATSRSPLDLPGESIISLAPLAVPTTHGDPSECASVQLFLDRCRDAGASVDGADLADVVELCRRLDGLPLALEIAAARARTMSIAEIARRLSESVDVLDRPHFRGDPRHRSVADTIRWSYELLEPRQAELLEELAVFAGPFTLASARAVTRDGIAANLDVDVGELVHVSLVVAETDGPETRYRLLDTVRRFAIERLRLRHALDTTFDRFVDHVVASLQQSVAGSTVTWRPTVIKELVAGFDDLAEALRWCIAHDETPARARQLCSILWAIVHQGHAEDIADLVRRTIDRWPDDGTQRAAQVSAVLATAEYVTGHPDRALAIASASLHGLQRPGIASVTLHRVLGQSRRALDDSDGALEALRAGVAIGHELGMTAMALELEVAAAQVSADAGEVDRAIDEVLDVLRRAEAIESVLTICWARATLGWLLLRRDPVGARDVIDRALVESRQVDYPIGIAVALRSRAFAELLSGDLPAAIKTVTELLGDLIARGALSNGRVLLDVAAAVAYRAGNPGWEQLAATARSLPITTMASARFELVPLPPSAVPPLPRHDAFGAVWHVFAELSSSDPVAGGDEGIAAANRTASIRRLGDVCEFTFAHRTTSLRAAKGVNDLVRLIEANGRELHCIELAGVAIEQASTGEMIDDTARRNYEQQIRDLQAEIDEAESNSDFTRAYRYQAELDTLIEHLTAALGRGGRTRREAGSAERARSAVTHRIRTTIRQIDRLHPALGRHLAHSVTTGTYCRYLPEQPTTWTIE